MRLIELMEMKMILWPGLGRKCLILVDFIVNFVNKLLLDVVGI